MRTDPKCEQVLVIFHLFHGTFAAAHLEQCDMCSGPLQFASFCLLFARAASRSRPRRSLQHFKIIKRLLAPNTHTRPVDQRSAHQTPLCSYTAPDTALLTVYYTLGHEFSLKASTLSASAQSVNIYRSRVSNRMNFRALVIVIQAAQVSQKQAAQNKL